jgi:hypothetical protein
MLASILQARIGQTIPGFMSWQDAHTGTQSCCASLNLSCVPWQDALIGAHREVQQLLLKHGGKVFRKGIGFVDCNSIDLTAW